MEREVKFRGKSKNTGDWLYGVPLKSVNDNMYLIHSATEDAINTFNDVDFVYSEVIPETVGQFTGLKDKNGVEIYEGDIVRYETDYDLMRFEVKWNKDTLMWEAVSQVIVDEPLYYKNGFIEIIGNIHDNPELTTNLE